MVGKSVDQTWLVGEMKLANENKWMSSRIWRIDNKKKKGFLLLEFSKKRWTGNKHQWESQTIELTLYNSDWEFPSYYYFSLFPFCVNGYIALPSLYCMYSTIARYFLISGHTWVTKSLCTPSLIRFPLSSGVVALLFCFPFFSSSSSFVLLLVSRYCR